MTGDSTNEDTAFVAPSEIVVQPDQVTAQELTSRSLKIDFGPSCSPQVGVVQETIQKRRTPVKRSQKLSTPAKRALHAKLTGLHSTAHPGEQSADNAPEDVMEGG